MKNKTYNTFEYAIHINELRDPLTGPTKFLKEFLTVDNIIEGLQQVKPNDYQLELIKGISENAKSISSADRQVGKTTALAAYALWAAMYNSDFRVIVICPNNNMRKQFLSKVRIIHDGIHGEWKSPISDGSVDSICFNNNSNIIMIGSDNISSYKSGIFSANLLIVDEFESCRDQDSILKFTRVEYIRAVLVSSRETNTLFQQILTNCQNYGFEKIGK